MAGSKALPKQLNGHADDLRGASRLALAGIAGIVDIVEAMHGNIAGIQRLREAPARGRTTGITGLVYRSIRGVVGVVDNSLDALLARLAPLLGQRSAWPGRDAFLAALNGVLGDYLAATGNPLAVAMSLQPGDAPAANTGKVAVLVHGLCLGDLHWRRNGHDYGAGLARDLGYAPVYVRYNSGCHVSTNGRELAARLEQWVRESPTPVTEIALIGHSMGGLLARSACHYGELAGHEWRRRLRGIVFLGTPHHGAPLERGGSWVDMLLGVSRYSAPLARLGRVRSAGITDLRHGNLVDEDWEERDRFERAGDRRVALPLPAGVACHAIAASTDRPKGALGELIGDGLVPVASALGRHEDRQRDLAFDASRQWVARGVGHLDLLGHPEVYARIKEWLTEPGGNRID